MDLPWADLATGLGMVLLMFGMGLTLQGDDFRRIAADPRPPIVGTLIQLCVMPVVGILLANFFSLSPLLSAGLVVVAACPGGMFSNLFVHYARGNTALSITLTASATLITLFTLPLWVQFALTLFSAAEGGAVEMPVAETALRLATLTVLPVLLGMLARARWPRALSWERRLSLPGIALIGFGVFLQSAERPDLPVDDFVDSLVPAAAFAASAVAVGLVVPRLFGIAMRDAVTIAVELVVKNTLLGLVLVGQALEFEAALPILAFAFFQSPSGILLLVAWRYFERRSPRPGEASPGV